MPFALIFSICWPLIQAILKIILPWLIDRITHDVQSGRKTSVTLDEVKMQVLARKDAIRKAYKNAD